MATSQALTATLARILGFPFTLLVKRDPGLTIVIHRPGTSFADNSKYFYIYATHLAAKGERIIMLTSEPSVQKTLTKAGGDSVLHPSWQSLWLLLRCGKVVIDMDWFNFGSSPLTHGAKLIQLWHGAPLKHIELDIYRKRLDTTPTWMQPFIRIQKAIIGRYPIYDIVVATSQWFIENTFKQCFKARQFVATGYPRNDILFSWPPEDSLAYRLAWINVDTKTMQAVTEFKNSEYKICLYAPTFRKELTDPFKSIVNLASLSTFAQKNNLLIVLKLHPYMHGHSHISRYPNIIDYAPLCDVYPLMPLCDLLITDYSSIFFDFLLFDRPIIFFAYDLESYLSQDREMYFDYNTMTPGAKCHTYDELEHQLDTIIRNGFQDRYSKMRKKIRTYTHDHIDNQACRRLIYEYLRKM